MAKINEIQAKRAEYAKKKEAIIAKANKAFSKALQNRDVEGMKAAVNAGADNINTPNEKGLTPLMQMVKEAESAKAYKAALYLISINVDVNAKDKDGATAEDYAAMMSSLKGQTLQREIAEKKNAEVNHGGNSKELQEINMNLAKADERIAEEKNKAYVMKADKNGWKYQSDGLYIEGNKHFIDGVGSREETELDQAKIARADKFYDDHLR